ncbi:MAG: YjbF family lipoprotein [Pseudomonadota bacterium]
MIRILRFTLLSLLIILTSCGIRIGTGAPSDAGIGQIIDNIQAARGRNTPEATNEGQITRARINSISQKLIRVEFTKYGIAPLMTQVASRQGFDTYLSTGEQTITLKDGRVSHTRGLPFDLLESDFGNDSARKYRFLRADNAVTELTASCTRQRAGQETIEIVERRYSTTLIEETCTSPAVVFTNRYWVDGSGIIWKSEQWLGPTHGFAIIQKLN